MAPASFIQQSVRPIESAQCDVMSKPSDFAVPKIDASIPSSIADPSQAVRTSTSTFEADQSLDLALRGLMENMVANKDQTPQVQGSKDRTFVRALSAILEEDDETEESRKSTRVLLRKAPMTPDSHRRLEENEVKVHEPKESEIGSPSRARQTRVGCAGGTRTVLKNAPFKRHRWPEQHTGGGKELALEPKATEQTSAQMLKKTKLVLKNAPLKSPSRRRAEAVTLAQDTAAPGLENALVTMLSCQELPERSQSQLDGWNSEMLVAVPAAATSSNAVTTTPPVLPLKPRALRKGAVLKNKPLRRGPQPARDPVHEPVNEDVIGLAQSVSMAKDASSSEPVSGKGALKAHVDFRQ